MKHIICAVVKVEDFTFLKLFVVSQEDLLCAIELFILLVDTLLLSLLLFHLIEFLFFFFLDGHRLVLFHHSLFFLLVITLRCTHPAFLLLKLIIKFVFKLLFCWEILVLVLCDLLGVLGVFQGRFGNLLRLALFVQSLDDFCGFLGLVVLAFHCLFIGRRNVVCQL